VSAGFATVHGNNSLTINAVEAYELDQFSPEVGILPLFFHQVQVLTFPYPAQFSGHPRWSR
jgi:hypothetical protein